MVTLPKPISSEQIGPLFLKQTFSESNNDVNVARVGVDLSLGQDAAVETLSIAFSDACRGQHLYFNSRGGFDDEFLISDLLSRGLPDDHKLASRDWVYVPCSLQPNKPRLIELPAASAGQFCEDIAAYYESLLKDIDGPSFEALLSQYGDSANLRAYLAELALGDTAHEMTPAVLVTHSQANEFPLIHCYRLDERRLFGEIRYETQQGSVITSQQMLQPGLLHLANGGVLVIKAEHLIERPDLWGRLKAVILTGLLDWLPLESQNVVSAFNPEPMPLNIRLILIGDRSCLSELELQDPEFTEFFSLICDIRAVYDVRTASDHLKYRLYIQEVARFRGLLPLSEEAIDAIANWSSRHCEDNSRVLLTSRDIGNLMAQACHYAHKQKALQLDASHVVKAIEASKKRLCLIADEHLYGIETGQVKLQLTGKAIGQVNGLTVIDAAGEQFGEPARITASVHMGDGDVIDIERKADMAGNIHAKSTMILSAFVHGLFSKDTPLPLSCSLVFEQSYYHVDGDSAGLAELLALLSSFSHIPIQQSFAITGAIDQFGQVMAVGGVNEKIEGFYKAAKHVAPEQSVSVILPRANINQLNLAPVYIEAIEQESLILYGVDNVAEAIALSMGMSAGELDDHGYYPENTVYGRIQRRVDDIHSHEKPSLWSIFFPWKRH
ncbi:AAA family ATPase [Corallincola platygyrae]|uniref:endopeptidase La n=1 Tax=Corallincola platygyrae TaxID=1193278 RepID=A0ABW4XKL8_9GAMM